MLALLCSGQGRQHAEMFRLTADHPAAAGIFEAAATALGRDARELARSGPPEELHANRAAQVLCVTQALAASAMLAAEEPSAPLLVAGYSIGELAAWGVAGALPAHAVPALAAQRATLMDEAGKPGDGLAFVRGLSERQVEALCAATGTAIAIINPDLVFVVGGHGEGLDALIHAALAQGAVKAGRLDVHTASHTPLLSAAVGPFLDALKAANPQRPKPGVTLLSALDGNRITDPARQVDGLARQLATTLRWGQCLNAAFERGASAVLELGPGRALAEMAGALRPDVPARSIDDFRSPDGLRDWLATHR